jgi:hypothetical protein
LTDTRHSKKFQYSRQSASSKNDYGSIIHSIPSEKLKFV